MHPGFRVLLNEQHLVTIAADNLNILGVSVMGSCVREELANCEVSGGLYNEGPENISLWWTPDLELQADDELTIEFLQDTRISRPGKTTEELYPEGPTDEDRAPSNDERLRQLENTPQVRNGFHFALTAPDGGQLRVLSQDSDHGFAFSVRWDWTRPEQARVSLHSYSLVSLKDRAGGTDYARFKIAYGDQVKFRVSER